MGKVHTFQPAKKENKIMIERNYPWLETGETLLCFGDSLTAAANGYVSMLEEKLSERKITVINAGRGGDKTPWALTRLQSDVIERKPDAVSIFLGANDAAVGRGRWADEPRVEPAAYQNNLIWMVHLCKIIGNIKKFSIATPTWRFEAQTYAEHGDILTPYCAAAREAAEDSDSWLVPLDTAFEGYWMEYRAENRDGYLLTRDGVHVTEQGNRLIADTMLKTWYL